MPAVELSWYGAAKHIRQAGRINLCIRIQIQQMAEGSLWSRCRCEEYYEVEFLEVDSRRLDVPREDGGVIADIEENPLVTCSTSAE